MAYGEEGDGLDAVPAQVVENHIVCLAAVEVVEAEETVLGGVAHAPVQPEEENGLAFVFGMDAHHTARHIEGELAFGYGL